MPGVPTQALNATHTIAGVDIHKQMPAPPPGLGPHLIVSSIGQAMPNTSKMALDVFAGPGGLAVARQHDLGIGIYHFAPNLLLPLVWVGAGNKAEFASNNVLLAKGPMAVAMVPVVGLNLQLDCNEPVPMPTSLCVASTNTVFAGFGMGDLLGGFGAMLSDVAVSFLMGKVAGFAGKLLGGGLTFVLGKFAKGNVAMMAAGVLATKFPKLTNALDGAKGLLLSFGVGSPVGYSFNWPIAVGSNYGTPLGDAINNKVAKYLSPRPAPSSGDSKGSEVKP